MEEGSAERCRRLVSLLTSKSPLGGGREGSKRKIFFDVGEVLCTQDMTGEQFSPFLRVLIWWSIPEGWRETPPAPDRNH